MSFDFNTAALSRMGYEKVFGIVESDEVLMQHPRGQSRLLLSLS